MLSFHHINARKSFVDVKISIHRPENTKWAYKSGLDRRARPHKFPGKFWNNVLAENQFDPKEVQRNEVRVLSILNHILYLVVIEFGHLRTSIIVRCPRTSVKTIPVIFDLTFNIGSTMDEAGLCEFSGLSIKF